MSWELFLLGRCCFVNVLSKGGWRDDKIVSNQECTQGRVASVMSGQRIQRSTASYHAIDDQVSEKQVHVQWPALLGVSVRSRSMHITHQLVVKIFRSRLCLGGCLGLCRLGCLGLGCCLELGLCSNSITQYTVSIYLPRGFI